MLDNVKRGLIGQVIEDAGIVNRAGVKHVRLILSDSETPLLVQLDDVLVTIASRKPMGRAQRTASPLVSTAKSA